MSDLSYDVLTALQSKLEAISAYEVYIEDCEEADDDECRQLFDELLREDERAAERLRDLLERMVKDGRFK
jgi:bacterioferritin (cytochrome b1)